MFIALVGMAVMGAGAFYLGWNLFSGQLEAAAESRLEVKRKKAPSALYNMNKPLFKALVQPYSQRLKMVDWRKKWKRTIISAGLEEYLDVDDLLAYKICLGFIVPLALFLYLVSTGGSMPIWVLGGMMLVGYVYPGAWVSGNRKRRHEEIKLQLPFVIDLLTLSTEAGAEA